MAKDVRATDALDRAPTATVEPFAALLRGSLIPTALVAGLGLAGAGLFGARAAWSAALGGALVIGFFSASLLVMRRTAHVDPATAMAIVLATYTVKILALGLVLVLLRDAAWLNGRALAFNVIACTLVWLATEVRAFTRLRILVTDAGAA